jgi:hypothetical protein
MLLPQMVFFRAMHVFLKLSCLGIFGANRAHTHLETPKLHEVLL